MNAEIKNTEINETAGKGKEKKKSSLSLRIVKIALSLAVVAVIFLFGFTFQVREGSCAVVLRFGAPRSEITEAGLYLRLPWPFENVVTYENRLQYLESNYLETTTKDKRNIIIQSYVVWKVESPLAYHNSVGTVGKVDSYIKDQVFSATNSVMGSYELSSLVSLDEQTIRTDEIRQKIFEAVRDNCEKNYGIKITDVSILRLSLPDTNLQSVFDQMSADRQKDIDSITAAAERDAAKIRSDADAEAARIIAEGVTKAGEIRAATETEVAKIYAEAQAANVSLYKFLKELDAVAASVGESTVLVINTDSYPFSVLKDYAVTIDGESDEQVIKDLNTVLAALPEADRSALTDAVYELIKASSSVSDTDVNAKAKEQGVQ